MYPFFKRIIDVLGALVLLVLLSPFLIFLLIVHAFYMKKNLFFTRPRIGYKEKPFNLIKLRTMLEATDAAGNPLPDEQRLTRYGKFLRAYSLDELPGIINVLKGDMSFIGPRPLLPEYLPYYSEEQRLRHTVLPGLTGLAQVNGRNALSWEEKFTYDVFYVRNISFFLDVKIFFKTLYKVIAAADINHENHATMPRFDDEQKSKNHDQ